MKRRLLLALCLLLPITAVASPLGCRGVPPNPVTYIVVLRARPGDTASPPGSFGVSAPTKPFPTGVQATMGPMEHFFIGLIINKNLEQPVTFSSYTLYRKTAQLESEIPLQTDELGPLNPGAIYLIGIQNPWPVPADPGIYQLRVYAGTKVVAAANFEITSEGQ